MSISRVDPHDVAAQLCLEIRYEQLPDGRHGLYSGDYIALRPGLTQREERSTLAHELGHHHYGLTHIPHRLSPKLEAACDLYAAEMLIDEQELLTLARQYPDDPARVAYELGVSSWVLEAWLKSHPIEKDCDAAA